MQSGPIGVLTAAALSSTAVVAQPMGSVKEPSVPAPKAKRRPSAAERWGGQSAAPKASSERRRSGDVALTLPPAGGCPSPNFGRGPKSR
ncbi:MAG: hypothetical protein NTZ05_07480, partial [Chloroflexi bacterium]|nr:hypothetical protein [Chloroflexota bacterium]